jgi:hypothetical protein
MNVVGAVLGWVWVGWVVAQRPIHNYLLSLFFVKTCMDEYWILLLIAA